MKLPDVAISLDKDLFCEKCDIKFFNRDLEVEYMEG
jgi:hypothetical protein